MFRSVVKYQPERTKTYLGTPGLVRLPDGALLAIHDYFGPGCPRNHENEESLTSVYRSEDDGYTWQNVTHLMNCYWNKLFLHNGSAYIMGNDQQFGSIHIRRSDDGGFTWTHPVDDTTGLLFKGGPYREPPSYHYAPGFLVHEGRIYRAYENCDPTIWGTGFRAMMLSAPVDADLLDASNWTMSNQIPFDSSWIPAELGEARIPGWREANVVADPDGQLWSIMIFEAAPFPHEKAVRLRILDDGKRLEFDPRTGWFDFPGSKAKFVIQRDPVTGKYLTIVNNLEDIDLLHAMAGSGQARPGQAHGRYPYRQRNVANLFVSDDLWHWRKVKTLARDDSGLTPEDSLRLTGFQYAEWQFDGDDLIYLLRTAHRGSVNFHDSNRILYCVLRDFRKLL